MLRLGPIAMLLQLAAFWPVLRWYVARMSDTSDEPWGLLALGTALFFIVLRGRGQQAGTKHLALASVFTLAYLLSYHFVPALARAVLAVLAIGCMVSPARMGRTAHVGIIGLLLLSLPVIASLQFYLGYPVRFLTAITASKLIGLGGYDVSAAGTCLYWAGEIISIDAPCTGVRMLWAGLYLNFTIACAAGHGSLRTWATHTASLLFIFAGNVLRATALFFTESGIVEAPGWAHQGIGLVAFVLVAAAIMQMNRSGTPVKGCPSCA